MSSRLEYLCFSQIFALNQLLDEAMSSSNTKIVIDWRIKILAWLSSQSKPTMLMSQEELLQKNQQPSSPVINWLRHGHKVRLPRINNQTVTGRHGDIPVRLYSPSWRWLKASRKPSQLPCVLFFHGGGWVTGNLDSHDHLCRQITHDSRALVISVGYRLAPAFPYPIPLEDCYDATLWAARNAQQLGVDPKRIMLMGDSAGGNLAAAVCLMARDLAGPDIHRQILIYPVVDGTLSHPSIEEYADAPVLTKAAMLFFVQQYASSPTEIQSAYFSPLLAEDLSQLPPALVITATYDPLRDEGQAYAQRLQAAGVSTQVTDYAGMVHGFLSFPRFCRGAKPARNEIVRYIQSAVSPKISPTESRSPFAKSPPD